MVGRSPQVRDRSDDGAFVVFSEPMPVGTADRAQDRRQGTARARDRGRRVGGCGGGRACGFASAPRPNGARRPRRRTPGPRRPAGCRSAGRRRLRPSSPSRRRPAPRARAGARCRQAAAPAAAAPDVEQASAPVPVPVPAGGRRAPRASPATDSQRPLITTARAVAAAAAGSDPGAASRAWRSRTRHRPLRPGAARGVRGRARGAARALRRPLRRRRVRARRLPGGPGRAAARRADRGARRSRRPRDRHGARRATA